MQLIPVFFVLALALTTAMGQSRYEPLAEKPGSCPPPLPVQICSQACFHDSQCLDIGKCCPTNCGGAVCTKPVTMRPTVPAEKSGSCPKIPKGRWVCSPTCSVDSDCRGKLKCCTNRCGAMACQPPEIEVVESGEEVPIPSLSEESHNVPTNPFGNFRNPNYYPYYFNNNRK